MGPPRAGPLRFAMVTDTHISPTRAAAADHLRQGLYHARFGLAPYSFDVAGVHFIGFDPTQALLETGHCGADGLRPA